MLISVLKRPLFRGAALSAGGIVAGSASLLLYWTPPKTNTDESRYFDPNTFKVYYGTQSGNLDQVVETTYGAPYVALTNLESGQTIYVQVSAINSAGTESALTAEGAFTVPTADAQPEFTTISSFPYTISQSGAYKIASSATVNSGAAITISANDVVLYGGNGFYGDAASGVDLTYAETDSGNAIVFSGAYTGVEIFGFSFKRGASTANGGGTDNACIYRNGAIGSGAKFHHNDFDLARSYSVGIRCSDLAWAHIFSNSITLRNRDGETSLNDGGTYTNVSFIGEGSEHFYSYSNTIVHNGTVGYTYTYHECGHAYAFNDSDTLQSNCDQGGIFQGWGNTEFYYAHGDIYVAAPHSRLFNNDGGGTYATAIHCDIECQSATSPVGETRIFRMRYGQHGMSVGYNVVHGESPQTNVVSFGGVDGSTPGTSDVTPSDGYAYYNTITGTVPFESYDAFDNFQSWANSYTAANGGTHAFSGLNIYLTNAISYGDTLSSSSNKVAGSNVGSMDVYQSFAAGDVSGGTTGYTFEVSDPGVPEAGKTPLAPTGLAQINPGQIP